MRFKIFILSTLLLTLITGMLFYKNLSQIGSSRSSLAIDFDELRLIDQEINTSAYYLRKNFNSDTEEILIQATRIKELLDIINDLNRNSPELKFSVDKIKHHFDEKQKLAIKFNKDILELRKSVLGIAPAYNDLVKNNINFILDKKDFYRECVLDLYMFIAFSHKENEGRILEDQKILGQIISYSTVPNPFIQKFSSQVDQIHLKVKETDKILKAFKDSSINEEMTIVSKFYQESIQTQSKQNENLLTFMVIGILIYLVFMIFILKKR
jgi:hypothetical protein